MLLEDFTYRLKNHKVNILVYVATPDVAVDLRKKSKTFGKIFKIILSDKSTCTIYLYTSSCVPTMAFVLYTDDTLRLYSCTKYRNANT